MTAGRDDGCRLPLTGMHIRDERTDDANKGKKDKCVVMAETSKRHVHRNGKNNTGNGHDKSCDNARKREDEKELERACASKRAKGEEEKERAR